jgi:uncharacterized membrane protein YciS (DUF1049 family)
MEKVCEWSERIEVQTSTTVERDVQVLNKRVINYERRIEAESCGSHESQKRASSAVVCLFTHGMKYNKIILAYYFDAMRLRPVRASKHNLQHVNRISGIKVTEKSRWKTW